MGSPVLLLARNDRPVLLLALLLPLQAGGSWSGPRTTVENFDGRAHVAINGTAHPPNWFVGSSGWGRGCGNGTLGTNLSAFAAQVRASTEIGGFGIVEICLPQWELDESSADGISLAARRVLDLVVQSAAPRAKLIVRILVEHVVEPITMQSIANGSEITAYLHGRQLGTVAGPWADGAAARLLPFVQALDRYLPGRVAGVHLTAMHNGEWNWPGACTWDNGGVDYYSDYSDEMRRAFCAKYSDGGGGGALDVVRAAGACELPSARARNIARTGNSFVCGSAPDPEASAVIAMNRFQSTQVAEAIAYLAAALKKASDGKLLVIAFHGYTYTVGDSRLAEFGHAHASWLIDSPHIDGFVAPYPYFVSARVRLRNAPHFSLEHASTHTRAHHPSPTLPVLPPPCPLAVPRGRPVGCGRSGRSVAATKAMDRRGRHTHVACAAQPIQILPHAAELTGHPPPQRLHGSAAQLRPLLF
jgi:hypothetical protein